MKTLTDQLAGYAAYHSERRNIATHLVGVPIFVAAEILFLLGARRTLQADIERRVGPTRGGARGDATA